MKNAMNSKKETIFDRIESEVQSYARSFPVVFEKAENATLTDSEGKKYIDFLAGAGSLNYGHNNPHLQEKLVEYVASNGITHSLDFHTRAKEEFLTMFQEHILGPRDMDFAVQFTGPTGTNAVEAALKLARMNTGRSNIIAFTNGFHGMTLGALAATGNAYHRSVAGVDLKNISRMPYEGYVEGDFDSIAYMDKLLGDKSSGIDHPAAVLVECIQGEGGLSAASAEWLQRLEKLCRKYEMLLIVDDIQAGCGRSGKFFSFEEAGIKPDIVTLSKSISGFGLPFALTIFKKELDQWEPGEHNATFRGNNHAFITASETIRRYWTDDKFEKEISRKAEIIDEYINDIISRFPDGMLKPKGRGMMRGIKCQSGEIAKQITSMAFTHNLVVETSGPDDEVVKCLCPLTIPDEDLRKGWDIIATCFDEVLAKHRLDSAARKSAA